MQTEITPEPRLKCVVAHNTFAVLHSEFRHNLNPMYGDHFIGGKCLGPTAFGLHSSNEFSFIFFQGTGSLLNDEGTHWG